MLLGSGLFCHDWASHCSVLFRSLDASSVFWVPSPLWTPNAAALRVGLCMLPGVQYHPVKE